RAHEATGASHDPSLAGESWFAQRADALVTLAKAYLGGEHCAWPRGTSQYQVLVHVGESALGGGEVRSGLPITPRRQLACPGDHAGVVGDRHGEPLSVGRKTRVVPSAIRRALWARDRGCRFPGCGRKRFVEPHHIEHWAQGGETSLANLMLLCEAHHSAVHEGGFRIEKDYRGRWFFRRPDGRAVPECGYRPEDVTDDGFGAAEEYFDGASAEASSKASADVSSSASAEVASNASLEVPRTASAKMSSDASAEAPTHLRSMSAEHQGTVFPPH